MNDSKNLNVSWQAELHYVPAEDNFLDCSFTANPPLMSNSSLYEGNSARMCVFVSNIVYEFF